MDKAKRTVKIIQNARIERMFYDHPGFNTVESPSLADLIVFPGGADVNPSLYGQSKHRTTTVNAFEDDRDQRYWKEFSSGSKKMLVGICRGGQFLNVMNGGQMWQNVNNHGLYGTHEVIDLLNDEKIQCTSTHHQMMIPNEKDGEVIGIAYESTRWADAKYDIETTDKLKRVGSAPIYDTEVVWYPKSRSLCFQPHPENVGCPKKCTDYFFNLIDRLF